MDELVNSPLGAADIEPVQPGKPVATDGAQLTKAPHSEFDAMLREVDELRVAMTLAIADASPKAAIARIFIRASDISAEAAGAEAQHKKKKNADGHAAFREVALRVDLLLAQWLVETEKAKLRFMGRHGAGVRAGTPAPPHLLTLGDLLPRHTQNQARKRSQDLRLLDDISPEAFEALVADPNAPRPRSGPEKRVLRLSAIRADERAQPRVALDDDRVAEYAEDMKRGCRLPPPVVFEDAAGVCWLADGFHRYRVAVALKRKTIECIVYQGELRDAVLHGCGANAEHGLRRSNQDKRRVVARMLDDEEWSHWTDREIARRCKVGHDLVGRLRREQLESVTSGNASEPRTYTNKHGTTSTMKTANIGRKPGKPEASGPERASPDVNNGADVGRPDQPAPATASPQTPPEPTPEPVPAPKQTPPAPAQPDMFKTAPPPITTPAEQSQEVSAEQRWRTQFDAFASVAITRIENWDRDFPRWKTFERPEDYPMLASIAAGNWAQVAAILGQPHGQ